MQTETRLEAVEQLLQKLHAELSTQQKGQEEQAGRQSAVSKGPATCAAARVVSETQPPKQFDESK